MIWYAGTHSINGGNNSGWVFYAPAWTWYAGVNSTDGGFNEGWIFAAPAKRGWAFK